MNQQRIAFVLISLLCGACSEDATVSGDAGSDPAVQAGPLVACELLSTADVDAAFSPRSFDEGEKGIGDTTVMMRTVTSCTYVWRDPSTKKLLMTVAFDLRAGKAGDASLNTPSFKKALLDASSNPDAVAVNLPGLGDAAYWHVSLAGGDLTGPIVTLSVFKGERFSLNLTDSAKEPDFETDMAVSYHTKLARAVLARL